MKRVVITGIGIWSCIGQDLQTVTESLKAGRSGIIFDPKRIEFGLHSGLVGNVPRPNLKSLLPRKYRATMSIDSEYAYMAAREAVLTANLTESYLLENEVGVIFGNEGNNECIPIAQQMNEDRDTWLLDPNSFFKVATSSVCMNLATIFHLKGININISAGCASASHAIGIAAMLIRHGLQHTILVGGASEADVYGAALFDAIGTLSLQNDSPQNASMPFGRDRDGAVSSAGAAALVIEEYEHAIARGATILAEIAGYGFSSSDIEDIFQPNSEGIYRAIIGALQDANMQIENIDYINSCASSSISDDKAEAEALSRLGLDSHTWISSTESMTGHEGWMAGASEAIYSILMMLNDFIAPTTNIDNIDEYARHLNIARATIESPINSILSTSSGLGGTNSVLIFKKI